MLGNVKRETLLILFLWLRFQQNHPYCIFFYDKEILHIYFGQGWGNARYKIRSECNFFVTFFDNEQRVQ